MKTISEAFWEVEIKGKDLARMFWEARTKENVGFYDNNFLQYDTGTTQAVKLNWEQFAKINNIKNFKYVK